MTKKPTLSKRVSKLTPSATLAIEAEAKKLRSEGADVISFGAGEPDFDTPSIIKEAAIESLKKGFTKYTLAQGILELRQAISHKLKRENGIDYSPEEIVVSCGAKHALYGVLQVLVDEGDEVLIPSPYWLSYPEMVNLAGGRPVFIETTQKEEFKISPASLKRAVSPRSKILILNSPSNPTGAVYEREELESIAQVVKERELMVVSDEIYEKLLFDGRHHSSIASFDSAIKERTITVNGHSKTYAMTGWRIGYLAAPREIASAVANLQSHSTSNPTSFAQMGALKALQGGEEEIHRVRKVFEERRNLIFSLASQISAWKPFQTQGAFYLFCDIGPTGLSSLQFAERLLGEAHVALVPGLPFGSDRHVRLSFATSEENIRKGLQRIQDWTKQL